MVKFFLSIGVDIDLQSDVGTPLMWAVGHRQKDVVKVLLDHHANVSALLPIKPLFSRIKITSHCLTILSRQSGKQLCGSSVPYLIT